MRFTGLRPATQNLNREDFILAANLGFDRSEHRDHQFSSLPIKFPMPAAHSLEEINEKEGLGEMNFVTNHIGVQKQGKVSRVYFISTAQEASVPKIALIPASTPCYFWHLCKLICKKTFRSPSVSLSLSILLQTRAAPTLSACSSSQGQWALTHWLQLLNTKGCPWAQPAQKVGFVTGSAQMRKISQLRHADRGTSHLLQRSSLRGSWERPCCLASLWGTCLISFMPY